MWKLGSDVLLRRAFRDTTTGVLTTIGQAFPARLPLSPRYVTLVRFGTVALARMLTLHVVVAHIRLRLSSNRVVEMPVGAAPVRRTVPPALGQAGAVLG